MLRKLAQQTAVYGISTILSKFLSYMLFPYFTRVLSKDMFGVHTELYAMVPFVLVLLTMGLETAYFRFASKAVTQEDKRTLFASIWGVICLASLAFLGLVFLFTPSLAELLKYASDPQYVRLISVIIAIDAISAAPFSRLRQEGRPGKYVFLKLVSVIVNIVFIMFFLSMVPYMAGEFGGIWARMWNPDMMLDYVLVANIIASAVTLLLLLPSCDGIVPRIRWGIMGPVFIYSLPLLLSSIAGTANEFLDRFIYRYLRPEDVARSELGVFSAVAKVGVIMMLFTQMYRLAAEPFFLSGFKTDDFRRTNAEALKYFMIISIGLFLFIGLFSDIFELLAGPDFREGMYLLPVIMVSNILSGVVLNLSFWYKQTGATKYALYVTGIGLIFTVVFNILLVPVLGILGSALARLICESVMVVVSYSLNRKYYPTPYDLRRIGEYVLLGGAFYATTFLSGEWPGAVKYTLDALLLLSYAVYVVKRERLDVVGILRSMIKR